jgi:hypothetical protein
MSYAMTHEVSLFGRLSLYGTRHVETQQDKLIVSSTA